jgi:UV DNA damage endonuclease
MKIGYPCLNRTIGCTSSRTFRLKSYSKEKLIEKTASNLDCLKKTLIYNVQNNFFFFRITSDIVPFASHPICTFNWQKHFNDNFKDIGLFIRNNKIRISMHPDQFTLINSIKNDIFERSVKELEYHAQILDMLGLDSSAKIQIHIGGVYGDKTEAMDRFCKRYEFLSNKVKKYLVIENDDISYTLDDCLKISSRIGTPILFDVFHHTINTSGESVKKAISLFTKTWNKKDGIPMVDYSSQSFGEKSGKHTNSIDLKNFEKFIKDSKPYDFDIMLEIKDKEKSAKKAVGILKTDKRFFIQQEAF